jgi:tetratricopeptide (TPR) repeat protein
VAETAETLTALMRKAESYVEAERLLDEVRRKVEPGEAAYKVLVDLSPDLLTAQSWVEEMRTEGMRPGAWVLTSVLSKDPMGIGGEELLDWYLSLEDRPSAPVQAAIDSYRRRDLIDDALRLALDYPHLDASRVLFADHFEQARDYLAKLLENDPGHANGRYAMGLALMAVGAHREALAHLELARELARPGPRVAAIAEIVRNVRGTLQV